MKSWDEGIAGLNSIIFSTRKPIVSLPNANHSIWRDLITGKKDIAFEFLAVKLALGTARIKYKADPSALPNLAKEFMFFFEKNQHLPAAQKDIAKLS